MFIEFNDGDGKMMVNMDKIQMFYYDKTYDSTTIILQDDCEIHVQESYQEVAEKIRTVLQYRGY